MAFHIGKLACNPFAFYLFNASHLAAAGMTQIFRLYT
jgi:hypothetical protein